MLGSPPGVGGRVKDAGLPFLFSTWRKCESGSGASFKMVLNVFMLIRMLWWRLATRLSPTIW